MNPFLPEGFDLCVVLASRSPRRADILRAMGVSFVVAPADESVEEGVRMDRPESLPGELARRKCRAVRPDHPGALVIAADTVVIVDGDILNKPRDDNEARQFLRRLAGRSHTVITGVAVARGEREVSGSERTDVTFRRLDDDEIDRYVRSGEGRDKAGAYAAQGLGAGLIRRIDGCFYNVVGLPVALVLDLFREVSP